MLEGQTFTPAPPSVVTRVLSLFNRTQLAGFVAVAIDLMDLADGDPDIEPNGDERDMSSLDFQPRDPLYRDADFALASEDAEADGDELDGTGAEDDFVEHGRDGPGCPIGDPGGDEADEAADPAWVEWQTRGRHKVDQQGAELIPRDKHGCLLREDDEDDGDAADGSFAEDEECASFIGEGGAPGCIISDPDKGAEDEGEIQDGI